MGDSWSELIKIVLAHPEKGALLLVLLAGAWRWLRELRHADKEDTAKESYLDALVKENRLLREELREERRRARRPVGSQDDPNSGRS